MVFTEFVLSESVRDSSTLPHSRNSGEGKEGTQYCFFSAFCCTCFHYAGVTELCILLSNKLSCLFCSMQEKNLAKTEGKAEPALYGSEDIRPLSIDDFKSAHEQVREQDLPTFCIHSCILVWGAPVNLFLPTVGLCKCFI